MAGLRPSPAAIQPAMLPSRAAGCRGSALLVFYCGLLNCCLRVPDVMLRPARPAVRPKDQNLGR